VGLVRARRDDLGYRLRHGLSRELDFGPWEALCKCPVALEEFARLARQRPVQIEAQVPPRRMMGSALKIFGSKISSAAPKARIVGDDHFAVIAQIGAAFERRMQQRNKQGDV